MGHKIFYYFIILCIILVNYATSSSKYEKISTCETKRFSSLFNSTQSCNECTLIEFICGDVNRENAILHHYENKIECNNYYRIQKNEIEKIKFTNCRFSDFNFNFFEKFELLRIFNISNVELEVIHPKLFHKAGNLTRLFASENRLKEIPSLLFVNANKLALVDFSRNAIEKIDNLAFAGENHIEYLILSHNNLTEFSELLFKGLPHLISLDLSHNAIKELPHFSTDNLSNLYLSFNNLSNLNEHTFNQTTKMETLILSNNPLGNLKVQTFAHMPNLKNLKLRRTNITNIQLGTFSHQHRLVILDLSENFLKELDFKLFLPVLKDLQAFDLSGNQLSHLKGFRNALFPQLNLLDIAGNSFNCSYLQHFMESVNWQVLQLHLAPHSEKATESNIRGVQCKEILDEPAVSERNNDLPNNGNKSSMNILWETLSKLNSKSEEEIFMKSILVLILIVLTLLVSLFTILNYDRICYQFTKSHSLNERSLSITYNKERDEASLF